jgi:hypothetical protein
MCLSRSLKLLQRTNILVLQPLIQCLGYLDKDICIYLQFDHANVFGVLTLEFSGGELPPDQVVKLWDLFLSQGLHSSVLSAVSRVLLKRDDIMRGKR